MKMILSFMGSNKEFEAYLRAIKQTANLEKTNNNIIKEIKK